MSMIGYYISKIIARAQLPSLRGCDMHKTAKVSYGSNLIAVSMGKYSYMGPRVSASNVEIGSFCSIASYSAIGGGRHPLDMVSSSPVFLRGRNIFDKNFAEHSYEEAPKTILGNDVWIGEKAFISAGVTIGNGAVVGAHSVVTKDVAPYEIVAGAPARHIRFRFSEKEIEALQELEWWNWDDAKIGRFAKYFDSPARLVEEVSKDENLAC